MKHKVMQRVMQRVRQVAMQRVMQQAKKHSMIQSVKPRLVKPLLAGATVALVAAFALSVACSPSITAAHTLTTADAHSIDALNNGSVNWSMEIYCATCHRSEAISTENPECPQAYAHRDEVTCICCHTESLLLETVHEGLTYADATRPVTKPTVHSVPELVCVGCHGILEEMAALTDGTARLTDSQGLIVNPHARPAGQTHEENPATCTDCHNNHSIDLGKDAMRYCASCHHRGVFSCGTCHELRTRT